MISTLSKVPCQELRGVVGVVVWALGDRLGWRLLCHARGKCPGNYVPFCHKLRGGGLLRYCPAFQLLPTFQRLKSVNLKRTQREGHVKKCSTQRPYLINCKRCSNLSCAQPVDFGVSSLFSLGFMSLQVIWTLLDGSRRRWVFRLWLGFSRHWWGRPYEDLWPQCDPR